MVYKFNSTDLNGSTLEISCEANRLHLFTSDYENDYQWNSVYLSKEDIDDLIIALTNIKNEISQFERNK